MSNINYTLRKSVSVNFVGRYTNIVVQLLVTAILARMLNPSDFGVMAIVAVLMTFFSFMSEMGLGPAVVQFQELSHAQVSGLFWITIVIGAGAAGIFAGCGPVIGRVYGNPEYVRIASGLGVAIALSCWTIVPLALLRRAQRFRVITVIEVGAAAISGLMAVAAAYRGAGVFALVIKSGSYALVMFALCCICCRLRMLSRPSISGMRHVFKYSAYQFMFNVVNYFTRNLDKLLIGKVMGPIPLGLYDMSYRLMLMPVSNLTNVITPALQPVYSAHQKDIDLIFRSYQKLVRFLIIAGGFVGVVCLSCGNQIILAVYGAKWVDAIPIFYVLSFSITVQVVLSSTGSVFQAIGRTDLLFIGGVLSALTSVSAIIVGTLSHNIIFLSWLLVVSFNLNGVQGFYILVKNGFVRSLSEFFGPSAKCIVVILICDVMCVAERALSSMSHEVSPLILTARISAVAAAYMLLMFVTGDAAFIRRALVRREAVSSG
ncbi:oligosaccharide flippase family protein [Paraburkholderia sp. 1N]|uniref:Oligosaccharide flippase family protein n=1 Tax=Paraburkholderia solitsugae TaxID=2675748 RepID=A0ABX2BKN7_9BURK|nr:lipopolysaccharide biosynthesis protein [Paraburkholderia solitsugae]NPT40350.1 oligosaccharide flippase family protein [Paraburkholderia solitsugae]